MKNLLTKKYKRCNCKQLNLDNLLKNQRNSKKYWNKSFKIMIKVLNLNWEKSINNKQWNSLYRKRLVNYKDKVLNWRTSLIKKQTRNLEIKK